MTPRSDAARVMVVFKKHWKAFKAELKGMDIKNPGLTWSQFLISLQLFVYRTNLRGIKKDNG